MLLTTTPKKTIAIFAGTLLFALRCFSQNVGINTPTPEAALDINGDIIIRTYPVTMADGITPTLDVNTIKFSYYRITGPTADFTLAGITAGIDGRLVTLFNLSGFTMQLNNEDNVNAILTEQIVTGTNADITIINKGIVNLQYDGAEQKWIVKSSSKGAGPGSAGYWDLNGIDLFNNTGGNVGIGTNSPVSRLTLLTDINTPGWTHIGQVNGLDSIIIGEAIGGVSAAIGTSTNHALRLNTAGTGKMHIYPAGEVVVGTNFTPAFGKFTVETPNNSDGIAHISTGGVVLKTHIGGTSAGIGTYSNAHMRIFCNGISEIFIAAATGNVGIGTENYSTYKLAVNGSVRSKEVVVETGWADYVFDKNYKLPSLYEVERFIRKNKHLINIPSAKEVEEKGLHLGNTQKRMMEKIEELTLYVIQLQKEIDTLKKTVSKNN
jgi:hypothetical protein